MGEGNLRRYSTAIVWAAGFLVAFGVRGWLWLAYHPVSYSDTYSYRRLADAIPNPNWNGYDGTRTPGYPLVMALFGSDQRVYLAQLAMGLVITLLLFYLGWQVSGKVWFGGTIALAHSLNLGQLFFEADLLTETPATFWIMLSLAGLAFWLYHPKYRSIGLAFGLGIASAAAALTRQLFVYLPLWIALFLLVDDRRFRINFQSIWRVFAYLLPVVLIIGWWINFIHSHFHDWALTTMTGYQLVQHTGSYFEYVPDKYAAIRDTYIKYRDAQIAQHGSQANAIWDAIPEMTRVSGQTFFDLNRTLLRISTRLILEHPDRYLRNCLEGWWMFWRSPVYWSADSFHVPHMAALIRPLIGIERLALQAANMLFILLSLASAALAVFTRRSSGSRGPLRRLQAVSLRMPSFLWFLSGTIWITSILQTFPDHGDNPRFLVPLQSLVLFWLLWFGWQLLRKQSAPVE